MSEDPEIDWEVHIWREDMLREFKEHGEEEAWQDFLKGKIGVIEWNERVMEVHKWVRQKLSELNN